MSENASLVDQARKFILAQAEAGFLNAYPGSAETLRFMGQLADRVQELEGRSPPSSVQPEPCEMGDICIGCTPRLADGGCPGNVQPEKERRPLSDEQINAIAREVFPPDPIIGDAWSAQWDREVGRPFARAIEAAHGISPSPSMVGREDTPHE